MNILLLCVKAINIKLPKHIKFIIVRFSHERYKYTVEVAGASGKELLYGAMAARNKKIVPKEFRILRILEMIRLDYAEFSEKDDKTFVSVETIIHRCLLNDSVNCFAIYSDYFNPAHYVMDVLDFPKIVGYLVKKRPNMDIMPYLSVNNMVTALLCAKRRNVNSYLAKIPRYYYTLVINKLTNTDFKHWHFIFTKN